jgi:hypothetical protein
VDQSSTPLDAGQCRPAARRQFLAVAVIGVVFLGLALLRFRKTAVTGVA